MVCALFSNVAMVALGPVCAILGIAGMKLAADHDSFGIALVLCAIVPMCLTACLPWLLT